MPGIECIVSFFKDAILKTKYRSAFQYYVLLNTNTMNKQKWLSKEISSLLNRFIREKLGPEQQFSTEDLLDEVNKIIYADEYDEITIIKPKTEY